MNNAFDGYRKQYYYPDLVAFMLRTYAIDYAKSSDVPEMSRIAMRLIHDWMKHNPSYEYSPDHKIKVFQTVSRCPVKGKDIHELIDFGKNNWTYADPDYVVNMLNRQASKK